MYTSVSINIAGTKKNRPSSEDLLNIISLPSAHHLVQYREQAVGIDNTVIVYRRTGSLVQDVIQQLILGIVVVTAVDEVQQILQSGVIVVTAGKTEEVAQSRVCIIGIAEETGGRQGSTQICLPDLGV